MTDRVNVFTILYILHPSYRLLWGCNSSIIETTTSDRIRMSHRIKITQLHCYHSSFLYSQSSIVTLTSVCRINQGKIVFKNTHMYLYYYFLNCYCYSITVVCLFSPSLHPTPAEPTSLPHLHPPPWFCPCVLYSSSCCIFIINAPLKLKIKFCWKVKLGSLRARIVFRNCSVY